MNIRRQLPWLIGPAIAVGLLSASAPGQLRLRDICHVKGQEENTLHGLGLVVGLKGTGDGDAKPTSRALARYLKHMGSPVDQGPNQTELLDDLKGTRNVALVFVTATVPAAGAREGSKLNCTVSAFGSAKSLAGGYLMMTSLLGPRPGSERVYAFAQGPIYLEDSENPNSGKIQGGCTLQVDFENKYHTADGKITLVLDRNHAGFQTAGEVADLLNSQTYLRDDNNRSVSIAKAIDQVNVQVQIPPEEMDDRVSFVSLVLGQRLPSPELEARVVINERTGAIAIDGDVEIGPVTITHKNVSVDTNAGSSAGQFVGIDPTKAATAKLKDLVSALNAVNLSAEDKIEIIKLIDRSGNLYGKLIIE